MTRGLSLSTGSGYYYYAAPPWSYYPAAMSSAFTSSSPGTAIYWPSWPYKTCYPLFAYKLSAYSFNSSTAGY